VLYVLSPFIRAATIYRYTDTYHYCTAICFTTGPVYRDILNLQGLTEEQLGLVNDMFDWLVDPCLYFIRKNCKTFIQTSEMHLVQSLMRLYTCLMDEIIHTLADAEKEKDEDAPATGLTGQQVCLQSKAEAL